MISLIVFVNIVRDFQLFDKINDFSSTWKDFSVKTTFTLID